MQLEKVLLDQNIHIEVNFLTQFGTYFETFHDEPRTGIPTAPNLQPTPVPWAIPANENVT